MFDPKADRFFKDPCTQPDFKENFGILYLLRRDIITCFGWDLTYNCRTSYEVLWPGGMAIFAGIDLLAKFYEGDDKGLVGKRFAKFIEIYFEPISVGDEETIYQLRNSLVHSFGLYTETTKNETYKFSLKAKGRSLVENKPDDIYEVDLFTLHKKFEIAINKYADNLEKEKGLQDKFLKMYENYGEIFIGELSK